MFKKILAKFGKGAATVDLRFENRPYFAGETVHGEVVIQGGEVEQKINSLAARFMMNVVTKQGSVTREVAMIPVSGAHMILPKEQKIIPFSYVIPTDLPLSRGSVSYYFDTHLDIEGGVDRTDVDRLVVEASKEVQTIFRAFSSLGLQEKATSGKLDTYGQEFSFFPRDLFAGQVNEIEVRFAYEGTGIRIWMEVDCRNGYHEIEAKRDFFLTQEMLRDEAQVALILKEYITEAINNPHFYTQPFSYKAHHHSHHGHGHNPIVGMVGGLAVGILGGMLLDELMDELGVDEMIEEAAEGLGIDEEDSFLGDFFGDDED